jgi:sodium/potassium-transporting ATPase subunit alpha
LRPQIFEIPFNSVNKWSLAVVADPGMPAKSHIVFMKGAPEIVLARCTEFMYSAGTRVIDDDFREEYAAAYERFGSCGERVLGFAFKVIPAVARPEVYTTDETACPKDGFTFCGLVSLLDPPRPGVAEAIATCRGAGIKVTMVTGDHPLTAEAIARKVNIITRATQRDVAFEDGVPEESVPLSDERVEAVVITGAQIGGLTQADWDTILSKREVVFARTSPQQKLRLVENYQRRGEIVAVTGDGVNDSPALKRAQIGVAMGSANASDVAREAADIVLLDDNFASIVGAIEEGRVLFDNLKKTVAYTLAHLWPELVPVFLNLAFSFPLAINGLMILTIDLLTEQGPAISLAYERAESQVMSRKPRNLVTDRLVSAPSLFYSYIMAGLANALVCMFAYFMVYVKNGIPVSRVAYSLDQARFLM